MNTAAPVWRPNPRRLWSNWLWVLTTVLSMATLWSGVRVVHDGRLRRETLRRLAQDKAREIAALGEQRFDLMVRDAFSPLWNRSGQAEATLSALRAYHNSRAACRCMDTLPIRAFFHYDASRKGVYDPSSEALTMSRTRPDPVLADSTVLRVARAAFDVALRKFSHPYIALVVDSTLKGHAIVTISDPHSTAGGTDIYGAVMPASALAATLFDVMPRGRSADTAVGRIVISPLHMDMGANAHRGPQLLQLDSMSVSVSAHGHQHFGGVAADRFSASAPGPGDISPFQVTVAIKSTQASMSVLMPVAHDRLWLNGVLVLSTILVFVFAVGSSRRELLLARARSDFIAGVSHDLRMPLAQILLASETLNLNRDRDEKERGSLTASIVREGRRLANMIDNLLLVSRTGAVGLEPRIAPVIVADLFTEVVESIHLAAADAGQSLETDAPPGMTFNGDRNLLRQALVNLVDNAIKYGKEGQRIRISVIASESAVRLIVDDEGPGIPAADRERLFEPYERLGRDQTSERTGSGLGLAVVRQIVLAHRGSVTVGENGSGTRIMITLPQTRS